LSSFEGEAGRASRLFRNSRLRVAELDQLLWFELVAFDEADDLGRDPGEAASDREIKATHLREQRVDQQKGVPTLLLVVLGVEEVGAELARVSTPARKVEELVSCGQR
jgi:hypothetical protein